MLRILGEKIRDERKMLGITSYNLAEIAGISRMTLYRIEKGESTVKIGAYVDVLDALNLELIATNYNVSADSSTVPTMIKLIDYPELKSICWHIPNAVEISPVQAHNLYERNQRHIESESSRQKSEILFHLYKVPLMSQLYDIYSSTPSKYRNSATFIKCRSFIKPSLLFWWWNGNFYAA